jgi:hypothetical protein
VVSAVAADDDADADADDGLTMPMLPQSAAGQAMMLVVGGAMALASVRPNISSAATFLLGFCFCFFGCYNYRERQVSPGVLFLFRERERTTKSSSFVTDAR